VSGSESYDTWLNPAAPVYMNFYFFNVTNVKQLKLNWTRPHVRQIGPYVYREIRNKTDVELINAGATLRYRQHKWFVFDANRSCGLETDVFTTINIPLLVSHQSTFIAAYISSDEFLPCNAMPSFFLSFFLFWGGICSLCMLALRPASQAGPMCNLREGTSVCCVVLRDLRLFREVCRAKGGIGSGETLCHDIYVATLKSKSDN